MYIYLDESLDSIDFSLFPQYIDSISQLISSACDGCNLLHAKKSTFNSFITSGYFSQNQIKNIRQIMMHNYEINDLFEKIPYKILINTKKSAIIKENNTWLIPLSSIQYGSLQAVELLAEDLNDGKLLIHAVDHYQKINGYGKLSYKIIPRNGGGANIADNFIHSLKNSKDFTVVFCDSDRFSPNGNLSSVTKRCFDLSETTIGLSKFLHTDGREIENDLPLDFVTESHQQDPQVLRRIEILKETKEKINLPFMKYIDLKEGLKSDWIYRLGENTENFKFWENVTSELKKFSTSESNMKSVSQTNTTLLPMIAEKMAANTLEWLDNKKTNHPKAVHNQIKNKPDAESWLTHGENIFWLGCAMKKIRL